MEKSLVHHSKGNKDVGVFLLALSMGRHIENPEFRDHGHSGITTNKCNLTSGVKLLDQPRPQHTNTPQTQALEPHSSTAHHPRHPVMLMETSIINSNYLASQ